MKKSNLTRHFQLGGYTPTQLENYNYVPTYVGQPLEAQRNVGDKMLNLFQENLAQATAVDIMNANRKVVDGDNEINKEVSSRYKQELEGIAQSGDYENMTMRVNALARRYQTDPDVRALIESRSNWDKEQEMAREIRMKTGRDPLFLQDPKKHNTVSLGEDGNRNYNIYRSTAEAPLDWQAKRQDIWSVIQPNMGQLTQKEVREALADIPGYLKTGTWKGVSNTKIKNLLDDAVSSYEGTAEYRQELRHIAQTQPDANPEEVVKTRILKEGLLKTFSQTDPQYMKNWILEDQLQKAGIASPASPTYEAMPALQIQTMLGFNPDDFDIRERRENEVADPVSGLTMTYDTKPGQKKNLLQSERDSFNRAAMAGTEMFSGPDAARQAAQMGTDYYNTPQAVQAAKQYAEFVQTRYQFPKAVGYPEDISKGETFQMRNFLLNRVVFDPSSGKTIQTSNKDGSINEDFLKLIGGSANNLTVSGFVLPKNSYGKAAGNPRFGDAQTVNVDDEKTGIHKNLIVSRPDGYYQTAEGRQKLILNTLYNSLALNPGQVQNVGIEGLDLQAKSIPNVNDPSGEQDKILVYKVGQNDYSDNPVQVASYEALMNVLLTMNNK